MSAEEMKKLAEASPRLRARISGVFYLINIVGCIFAEAFVRGRLVTNGDAASTAHNILAHEQLFRLGFASDLIAVSSYIAVTGLFYNLFKPVNRNLSFAAAFFGLAGCITQGINLLNHFLPLILLGGDRALSGFTTNQLQALAYTSLRLLSTGYNMAMVFFGCYCLSIGYLIFRSTFLPRTLGPLLVIAGLCYQINSFANFLSPAFAANLFPYILMPGAAEILLCLWLLVVGVNVQRWKEQASAAGERRS
jgi:uncharacterized membrane protein